jgi:hypothetical protein
MKRRDEESLRFAETAGGPFLRESNGARIPPLIEMPMLLAAAEHVEDGTETADEIKLLLAPGPSPGARPKASVRDRDDILVIAKFRHKNDDIQLELSDAALATGVTGWNRGPGVENGNDRGKNRFYCSGASIAAEAPEYLFYPRRVC